MVVSDSLGGSQESSPQFPVLDDKECCELAKTRYIADVHRNLEICQLTVLLCVLDIQKYCSTVYYLKTYMYNRLNGGQSIP